MGPVFKDFLQGLLTKTPKQRLSWPALLQHPFVAHAVTGKKNIFFKNQPVMDMTDIGYRWHYYSLQYLAII